jgi:SAM-dependent methyltransferase
MSSLTEIPPADDDFGVDYLRLTSEVKNPKVTAEEWQAILRTARLSRQPGLSVLDAPCGQARFARPAADGGHRYVGIDRSEYLIRHAVVPEQDGVRLLHGEIEIADLGGDFDLVVNWFTSFGYDEDDRSRRCLRVFKEVLRPGGVLAMEIVNGPWLRQKVAATGSFDQSSVTSNGQVHDRHSLTDDGLYHRVHRTYISAQEQTLSSFRLRSLSPPEITAWLADAGFHDVEIKGPDGQAINEQHALMHIRAS